ncbi:uncharacterized protein LOC114357506 [Ostrinia furnacalis]|uniref:uncharacterized protein LOC114357506 n=1 Tax=Ostrinia furnacalis TaxID=93504 RepID=UPI00103E7FAC|nr:uncharacterized protein LOC114357506 [Ostrinia furnacalis]
MFRLSDNYYQRECYLKQEQVPTQSVMIKKMSPPLANVYFKSMIPKLKVLAGLEPPMKGGGSDWYIPPQELLEGKISLKPMKKEHLTKLGFNGIDYFGEKIVAHHHKCMDEEKAQVLLESDINWKRTIEASCRQQWEDTSREAARRNTEKIQSAFREFTTLYTTSIAKVESLLFDATIEEIKRIREETFQKMDEHYKTLLKEQATMLYDRYTEKLNVEKARLKQKFIRNVEQTRSQMGAQLHDIQEEKHTAIEKLRNLFECQNLACQVYVALKEREECEKEIALSKHKHEKQAKVLKEKIAMKDFEIRLAKEKEKKRKEFNKIWQKKICEVVKKFQMFVSYCLNSLPEHAEFFMNMEKLMLLQLNEAMENPSAESIFITEENLFHTPVPRPHPFFLFCDKGYKPHLNQDLCPKHCTSSASQLPVIVVNKRCIYAACDNFEVFSDKIKQYIHGRRGEDVDFLDDHDYTYNIPVTFTHSQQLLELKMESSLMQILQKEHPNIKQVQTQCCICKIPHCFCSRLEAEKIPSVVRLEPVEEPPLRLIPSGNKLDTRSAELIHEREPKVESYIDYMEPKKCNCAGRAKKNIREHLPAYMRNVSRFYPPDLPHYEPCSVAALKKLVKKAQGRRSPPELIRIPSRTKEVSTQYSDQEFDLLCTCFSDEEIDRLFKEIFARPGDFHFVDGSVTASHLERQTSSFATHRAHSLRNLMAASPHLEEIFKKTGCDFDD